VSFWAHFSGSGFDDLTSIWLARHKDISKKIAIKKTYLDISDSDKIDLMRVSVFCALYVILSA
jgi:hypothetical protein